MPRTPLIIRPSSLHISLPEDIRMKLDLVLHSDLEGKVPKGSYQRFFMERVAEFFTWGRLDLSLYGFPSGYFVSGPKEMVSALRIHLERTPS